MEDSEKSEKRKLTEGEKVVGIGFNPAKDQNVQEIKELCAKLVDKIESLPVGPDPFHVDLKKHAKLHALDAQMAAVKAATYAL